MKSTPINSPGIDLAPVFGTLNQAETLGLVSELQQASARLLALRESLPERAGDPWTSDGVCLDTLPSGQASITAYVEDSDLCFWLELSPQGGDAWEVEARVMVAASDGSDTAAALPDHQCSSPAEACTAFVAMASELSEIALSRPPLASAWPTS